MQMMIQYGVLFVIMASWVSLSDADVLDRVTNNDAAMTGKAASLTEGQVLLARRKAELAGVFSLVKSLGPKYKICLKSTRRPLLDVWETMMKTLKDCPSENKKGASRISVRNPSSTKVYSKCEQDAIDVTAGPISTVLFTISKCLSAQSNSASASNNN